MTDKEASVAVGEQMFVGGASRRDSDQVRRKTLAAVATKHGQQRAGGQALFRQSAFCARVTRPRPHMPLELLAFVAMLGCTVMAK
jgi:hypothetical protein